MGPYMKTLTFVKEGLQARPVTRDHPEGHMTSIHLLEHNIHIHSVYRPQNSNEESWIHQRILETKNPRAIFCGDFNRIGLQGQQNTNLLDFLHSDYPILNDLEIPS